MSTNNVDITTPEDAKSAILNYIDDRLEEWAEWCKKGSRLGIGYPPCSIEYRLMTEGHVVREYIGLRPTPVHATAEEMENLIREMVVQNHKMADVIKYYYLNPGGIRHNARKLGMSHAHFETHLNIGRWWLAGRLTTQGRVKELTSYFRQLKQPKNEKV